MGIFDKFKSGFKKSASAFTSGLRDIVVKKEIDDKTLDRIEEYLIQSDVGVVAASEIKEIISDSKIDPKKDITEEISTILKEYIVSLMKPLENNSFFQKKEKINAILVSGVNEIVVSTSKTTVLGSIISITSVVIPCEVSIPGISVDIVVSETSYMFTKSPTLKLVVIECSICNLPSVFET